VLLDTIAYPQAIPVFFKLLDRPVLSQVGVRMAPPSVQIQMALRIAYFDNSKIGADEIIVLDQGVIVERGNHHQLMAKGGLYASMWNRQREAAAAPRSGSGPVAHLGIR